MLVETFETFEKKKRSQLKPNVYKGLRAVETTETSFFHTHSKIIHILLYDTFETRGESAIYIYIFIKKWS